MDNLEQKAVVLRLIDDLRKKGSWCGETHVQKSTLFLTTLQHHALEYHFILYKHGPYSFDLSDEITAMRAYGFLDWDVPSPQYGPRLKATDLGHEVLKNYSEMSQKLVPAIDFVTTKLAGYGVATLERLATALYFSVHKRIESTDERARKIHEIKRHISERQALDAITDTEAILSEWNSFNAKTNLSTV